MGQSSGSPLRFIKLVAALIRNSFPSTRRTARSRKRLKNYGRWFSVPDCLLRISLSPQIKFGSWSFTAEEQMLLPTGDNGTLREVIEEQGCARRSIHQLRQTLLFFLRVGDIGVGRI